MRVAALTPCFDPLASDGATRLTGRLAQALAEAGVSGHWLATTASRAVPTSAWSNRWPQRHPAGRVELGPLQVARTTIRRPLPQLAWRLATRGLLTRMQIPLARASERARSIGPRAWQEIRWPTWVQDYILAALGPDSPAALQAFQQALKGADVAIAGYPPLGLPERAARLARAHAVPLALLPLFHANDPLNSLPRWIEHYRSADLILTLTDHEAGLFRELFHHANVRTIGAAIDPADVWSATVSGHRFRERHGLGDAPMALFLGRKEAGKNYRMAIEAVQIARAQRPTRSGLKLVLIGADVDHQPVSPEEGLYLGPLSRAEVLDALDACDVLINPSTSESFGLTILEAWARRKPVIANAACGPFRSIIQHDHNGWLEADVDGMARRIAQVLSQPLVANARGSAGHQTLLSEHLWPHVAKRTLDALESIRTSSTQQPGAAVAGH